MDQFDVAEHMPNVRSIPISLTKQQRYRERNREAIREADRNRKRTKHFEQGFTKHYRGPHAEVARRVDETEVSEPPVWRKGPMPAINKGWSCWVLTFDAWPRCTVYEALVLHTDLTEKLYIVNIKGRKRAVSAERVFSMQAAAQQEAVLYETINAALYAANSSGTEEESTAENESLAY